MARAIRVWNCRTTQMLLLKTIRSRCFHPWFFPSKSSEIWFPSYIFRRPFSLSSLFTGKSGENRENCADPLSVHFRRAVGLIERRDETSALDADGDCTSTNSKLTGRLRKLEEEVRILHHEKHVEGKTPNPPKNVGKISANGILRTLFDNSKMEEVKLMGPTDSTTEYRAVSPDMQMLAHHLCLKGYLRDANFMSRGKFDLTLFEQSYARDFFKFAAVEFGKDHSEIVNWLSASDLKKVALFGCPSSDRKSAYASKFLRGFFQINELKVCQTCALNKSCKHANKQPQKDCSTLNLHTVMSVLIVYALDLVPQELVVPDEVKRSVSVLLKEIVNLTQKRGSSSLC